MKKVLILEDNTTMQSILEKFIKKYFDDYNFEIFIEANGEKGLATLEAQNTVDLIITDLNMPVLSGFDFIKELKQNTLWKTIPIIVASALEDQVTQNKLLDLNIRNFIAKPYDIEGFKEMIRGTLAESENAAFTTDLTEEVMDFIVNKTSLFIDESKVESQEVKNMLHNLKNYLLEDLENPSNIRDLLLKYSPENELIQNGQVMDQSKSEQPDIS